MSRLARVAQRRPKQSSSRPRVTERLRSSWTRWRLRRTARQAAKWERRLASLIPPDPGPALLSLGSRLDLLTTEVETVQALVLQQHRETVELLVEVLQGMQPRPEAEIALRLGLPTPLLSSPSSES